MKRAATLAAMLIMIGAGPAISQTPHGTRNQVAAINGVPFADAFPDASGLFQPLGNDLQQIQAAIRDCPPSGCAVIIPAYMTGTPGDWTSGVTCNLPVLIQDWRGGTITYGGQSGTACSIIAQGGGYAFLRYVYLTTAGPGTFTPTAGDRALFVQCQGGGGGSGGTAATGSSSYAFSGGGGGGAYAQTLITAPLKASYSCIVGAGGLGGATGNNTGGTGGDTSFDSPNVCLAKGGLGGQGSIASNQVTSSYGGEGGPASTSLGDFIIEGGDGGIGFGGNSNQFPAFAGTSHLSSLNWQGAPTFSQAPNKYGGGGLGVNAVNNTPASAGNPGAQGVIIVTEYR